MKKTQETNSGASAFDRFLSLGKSEMSIASIFCTSVPAESSMSKTELGLYVGEDDDRPVDEVIKNLTNVGLIKINPESRYFMEPVVKENIQKGMEKLIAETSKRQG